MFWKEKSEAIWPNLKVLVFDPCTDTDSELYAEDTRSVLRALTGLGSLQHISLEFVDKDVSLSVAYSMVAYSTTLMNIPLISILASIQNSKICSPSARERCTSRPKELLYFCARRSALND